MHMEAVFTGIGDVVGGRLWFYPNPNDCQSGLVRFHAKKECENYIRKNFPKPAKAQLLKQLAGTKGRAVIYA